MYELVLLVLLPVPDWVQSYLPRHEARHLTFSITPVFFNVGINEQVSSFNEKMSSCNDQVSSFNEEVSSFNEKVSCFNEKVSCFKELVNSFNER
jgi:hypothetical protein